MFATAQCQNPLAVGASGSKTVTAKLRVPSGKPDHDNWVERSSPPAPMTPLTWGIESTSPSDTSVLVTVKLGASGRKSYGLGGVGRSAMGPPGSRERSSRPDPRHARVAPPVGGI